MADISASMVNRSSCPVVLKKFEASIDPSEVRTAEVSRRCVTLAALGNDDILNLWKVENGARWSLMCTKQFKWCLPEDSSAEDVHGLPECGFALLKSDSSLEFYSLSQGCEEISCVCELVITKDLLKGLLNDRGKEWNGNEIDLLSVGKDLECDRYKVALLLDKRFLVVVHMSKTKPANIQFCVTVDDQADITGSTVCAITRLSKGIRFFFTLLSNGVVYDTQSCDLVASLDLWLNCNYCCTEEDIVVPTRPNFCHMEVTQDLSLLVAADTMNNIYLLNLAEVLGEHTSQEGFASGSQFKSAHPGFFRFKYESGDEDSLARDAEMTSIMYGDRVWKAELLAYRRIAEQPSVKDISGGHPFCALSSKKKRFGSTLDIRDNSDRYSCASGSVSEHHVQNWSDSPQAGHLVPCQAWMEKFHLMRLFVTPNSFLLWLKADQLTKDQSGSGDLSHGVLCLFTFSSQKFVYHWLSEASIVVNSHEAMQPVLLLNSNSLVVPAFDISQDQLVHKMIIFESARLADSLCHLNEWDHCTIPINALDVALRLRQLDTVAFFLKNQEKESSGIIGLRPICGNAIILSAFISQESPIATSPITSSPRAVTPPVLPHVTIDTIEVKAVTMALLEAVAYNIRQQHNLHFTRQLAQMTLNYLHNLMKDGASLLEADGFHDEVQLEEESSTSRYIEVKECMDFFSSSIEKLRCHLSDMPVDENVGPCELEAPYGDIEINEEDEMTRKWIIMTDKEVAEDAIVNRQMCLAQTFFQSRNKREQNVQCDGSYGSLKRLGLEVVLHKLLNQDMESASTMLSNMGRGFLDQVHKICHYTLHRPLRDLLVKELEANCFLSSKEKEVVEFIHELEVICNQASFAAARKKVEERAANWEDLGLLKSSFHLGSNHILETYIKTDDLLSAEANQEVATESIHYFEVPLIWAHKWDEISKQKVLVERMFSDRDSFILPSGAKIDAEALWNYLTSHMDWQTLLAWIRAMAFQDDCVKVHTGDVLAVQNGEILLPLLPPDVMSDYPSCPQVLKDMVMEECLKNGLLVSCELLDFPVLLHYVGITQTLFADKSTVPSLGGPANQGDVSATDFHRKLVDYCVKMKLVNLLYHYLDYYRLCETTEGMRELQMNFNQPRAWVDLLAKFRFLGLNPTDADAVFAACVSNFGLVTKSSSLSITDMLNAGKPVSAVICLLYGPNSLTQAIVPSGSLTDSSLYRVEDSVIRASLVDFPKLRSAIFPVTFGVNTVDSQDVSVYQLLQGNCPFEISRLFGWQTTNELAQNRDTPFDMPHFSHAFLVSHRAHVEKLTFSYYLRQARPSFAFASFVGDHLTEKVVTKARIQHAALKAYRVAVQHLSQQAICSACVAFTEMLGLDSTPLRVDVQTANRILAHAGKGEFFDSDGQDGKTLEEWISFELLSCARKTSRQPKSLLKALEAATKNYISKECLDQTSFEASQAWHLVILFCRVHKMELSHTFLQDCAKAEKWLPFVCHAHVCQFPKKQVLHIIEHDFSNPHIKEHLQLAFENVLITKVEHSAVHEPLGRRQSLKKRSRQRGEQPVTTARDVRAQFYARMGVLPDTTSQSSHEGAVSDVTQPSCSSSAEDEDGTARRNNEAEYSKGLKSAADKPPAYYEDVSEKVLCMEDLPHDLFDIVFKCESHEVPWRSLLAHAVAFHRSILPVLASCYKEAQLLDCLCTWLCSTLSPPVLEPALSIILSNSKPSTSDIQNLQWHQWKLDDLSSLIIEIVGLQENYARTLINAFYIFDPNSPLLSFFHFYESFVVHSDYEACQEYLKLFKKSHSKMIMKITGGSKSDVPCIGNPEWLERLTVQVTKLMLSQCGSAYEQQHLLSLLAAPMFGRNFSCPVPSYHKLHEISTIIRGKGTEFRLDTLLEEGSDANLEEKKKVLCSLLDTKHFAEARQFASLVNLHDDNITLKEVEADLESTKNSMLWEIEQGRLAFWQKAEKCFRTNSCKPETAGLFFETRADDEQLSFKERAQLLSIAVKWFSLPVDGQQAKTVEEIQELQKKTWLLKIQAEIERDSEAKLVRSVSHLEFLPQEAELEFESKSNKMDTELHKMVDTRELVQEDVAYKKSDAEPSLKTDNEIKALEYVIGQLLKDYSVTQARWLAQVFNHSSLELGIVMSCIYLAQGTRSVETLDDDIQTLLSVNGQRRQSISGTARKVGRSDSFVFNSSYTDTSSISSADWVQVADLIAVMEGLAFHCRWGKKCCNCIITCYKVAQTLMQDYETIVNEKPFHVLHSLLVSGFDSRFNLMDSYIKAMHLDTAQVTRFLSDTILRSLRVYTTGEELCGGEYDDLIVNAAPSCEDISHMIRLCPDYTLLGNSLLDKAKHLASQQDSRLVTVGELNLEVELLVRAHECHTMACNMEGISSVLRSGRLLTAALAEAREYGLLVRLLTGVGRFHEMSYIFDTLFEHEHFELLCRRGIDKENKLKVALLDYLRRQHPEDTDKYSMVAHHFRMYREIAETLEDTAVKQLNSLGDCCLDRRDVQATGDKGQTDEVFSKLNSIMKSFCYASDNYAKENCWRHSQTCLKKARLVHFQIQLLSSGVTVVNLSDYALKKFLANHAHFFEALIVVEAYKKHDVSLWVDAVYTQVVVRGETKYLQDMSSAIELTDPLFTGVASRYKSESRHSSQAISNMKTVLGFVSNVRERYKLATELGFRDMASSILEEEGGAFLRDSMVM